MLQKSTFDYLRDLAKNNDRDWFNANRDRYEAARANVAEFADALLGRLREKDVISTESGAKSLFRIYRDVRFSKNKLPYKINFAGQFVRDGKQRRGGYYFSFSPGENMVGGGFYGIERDDLKRIREDLAADGKPLRAIMQEAEFVNHFGTLQGEKLKTAPQGYARDHENIDLLRFKQFYGMATYSEKEVLASDFVDRAAAALGALRPFFDYFSEVLTTDANGRSLLD